MLKYFYTYVQTLEHILLIIIHLEMPFGANVWWENFLTIRWINFIVKILPIFVIEQKNLSISSCSIYDSHNYQITSLSVRMTKPGYLYLNAFSLFQVRKSPACQRLFACLTLQAVYPKFCYFHPHWIVWNSEVIQVLDAENSGTRNNT